MIFIYCLHGLFHQSLIYLDSHPCFFNHKLQHRFQFFSIQTPIFVLIISFVQLANNSINDLIFKSHYQQINQYILTIRLNYQNKSFQSISPFLIAIILIALLIVSPISLWVGWVIYKCCNSLMQLGEIWLSVIVRIVCLLLIWLSIVMGVVWVLEIWLCIYPIRNPIIHLHDLAYIIDWLIIPILVHVSVYFTNVHLHSQQIIHIIHVSSIKIPIVHITTHTIHIHVSTHIVHIHITTHTIHIHITSHIVHPLHIVVHIEIWVFCILIIFSFTCKFFFIAKNLHNSSKHFFLRCFSIFILIYHFHCQVCFLRCNVHRYFQDSKNLIKETSQLFPIQHPRIVLVIPLENLIHCLPHHTFRNIRHKQQ